VGKQHVVSIHGISTDGAWQNEIAPIFDVHFTYYAHHYSDFRRLGPIKLLCGEYWWAFLVAIVGLVGAPFCVSPSAKLWIFIGVSIILLSVLAKIEASRLHEKATRSFLERIGKLSTIEHDPHVIAHSLGTLITGKALHRHRLIVDRIVLLGGVLSSKFNWDALSSKNPPALTAVRNEVGRLDYVQCLAHVMSIVNPLMGNSGLNGFVEVDGLVHTISDPWEVCRDCTAVVHNVIHDFGQHTTLTQLAIYHARRYWLPFFWGIPPRELREFVRLCVNAHAHPSVQQKQASLNDLETRTWSFLNNLSLRAYIKAELAAYREIKHLSRHTFGQSQAVGRRCLRYVAALVYAAEQAAQDPLSASASDLRFLMPLSAVSATVSEMYQRTS